MMCYIFLPFGALYFRYDVFDALRAAVLLGIIRVVIYLFLHSFYRWMIHLIVLFVEKIYLTSLM
jgi:hypothetical protein